MMNIFENFFINPTIRFQHQFFSIVIKEIYHGSVYTNLKKGFINGALQYVIR